MAEVEDGTVTWRKGGTAYLICKLTQDEVKRAGKNLAEALQRKRELESRLESVKQQIKGEITSAEGDAQKFEQLVATESEGRMVPVDLRFDFKRSVKETIRTDTGEVVKSEPITDEERQRELPLPPAPPSEK